MSRTFLPSRSDADIGGRLHNDRASGRPVIAPYILHRLAGGYAADEPLSDDLPNQAADGVIAIGAFALVLGLVASFA